MDLLQKIRKIWRVRRNANYQKVNRLAHAFQEHRCEEEKLIQLAIFKREKEESVAR